MAKKTRRLASKARRSTSRIKPRNTIKTKTKTGSRSTARTRKSPVRKSAVPDLLARNKKLVLAFYQKIIGEKDYEGARRYMGTEYTQHAPYAADGHAGIAEWVRKFKEAFPNHRYEVKKVIAEGDLVVLHLHGMAGPNPHGESVVDIFRIKDGKVVEHWDVIQPIPDSADNANSMF